MTNHKQQKTGSFPIFPNGKRGGTISFVVSLVMVALFVVAIVTFSINLRIIGQQIFII